MAFLKQRPSPSMVVAIVALFFALTGWGVAGVVALTPNSVGTQQIVNGSIRLSDLNAGTVKALRGLRGPQGPEGPQGLQGQQGVAGGFNPAKLTYAFSGNVSVPASNIGSAVANCPAGSMVVGGWAIPASRRIDGFAPTASHTGFALVVVNDTNSNANIAAGAICASP